MALCISIVKDSTIFLLLKFHGNYDKRVPDKSMYTLQRMCLLAPLISMHIPVIGGARRYQLEGIVEHIGTTMESSGNHYVSFIKKDNQWYRISDAHVTATTQLSRQPYVSLYMLQN